MDQMHAAALVGEHLRDEQTLLQLATEFGALLHERALGIDLFAAGQERRIAARHRHQQFADAQEARAVVGRFVVEGGRMTPEEFFLHAKRLRPERRGFSGLAGLEQAFDFGEVFGGYFGIACERGAENRLSRRRRSRPNGKCLHRKPP